MSEMGLSLSLAKMRAADVDETAISVFEYFYRKLESGATGLIPESTISALANPAKLADLNVLDDIQAEALAKTAVIKLNGGLGTSMGLNRAKTLLNVREGKTFLDLSVEQVLYARKTFGVQLPLIFMNSFRTQADTLAYLERYPQLSVAGLPLDFLQNSEPKLLAEGLTPVEYPKDPTLEWCPPGHGDIYTALLGSGLLQQLLDTGFRYLFISNGDNLGATADPVVAGWFAQSGAPFVAEVCTRTPNDRKGGHLAIRKADGRLILRESAQTAPEDKQYFEDESIHRYFNANNLWIDLIALDQVLTDRAGVIGLPLICNEKTVDPANPNTAKVYQIESAMGAAIEIFEGAQALVVERNRFLPVKTTNELLILRSDIYELGDDSIFRMQAEIPEIRLSSRYYKLIDDFDSRIEITPSLRKASSLIVEGDWRFNARSEVIGTVVLPDLGEPKVYPTDA